MAVVTNQPVQMSYFIRDISGAVAAYNRIRWYRSTTEGGLYQARTAVAAQSAVLVGSSESPHQANGKTLSFRVNGVSDVTVAFVGADPITTATVASEINSATPLVVAADDGNGHLQLTSATTGTGASIEILSGDANPFLGFVEGDGATGLDGDTVLVAGTHEYFYTDYNSDRDYWYRVEFYNTATAATSGLGVAFPANLADSIPRSQTIVGSIRLADLSGYPVPNRKITMFNVGMPNSRQVTGDPTLWGVARQYAQITTDRNGYAEYRFLRGITIDINIEGGVTRRITVPTTGDAFDLLDPALVSSDEFGIQEPNIPFAMRTT